MHKSIIQLLFVFLLIIGLTSCITTRQTNYLQAPKSFGHNYKDTVSYQDYHLKESDRIFIQVYSTDLKTSALFNGTGNMGAQMSIGGAAGESSDLYSYLVQSNGNIQFPIVGEIPVIGKTLRETKNVIEEAIKPILKINSVDVRLVGKSFSVIGSGKSGRIPMQKEKVNIFEALVLAGDVGFYTNRSKVKILRQNQNGTQIKTFDIRGTDIINSDFYYIEPDDVVFLEPMNAQFFGITTFWGAVSTVIATVSFVTGIYTIIVKL